MNKNPVAIFFTLLNQVWQCVVLIPFRWLIIANNPFRLKEMSVPIPYSEKSPQRIMYIDLVDYVYDETPANGSQY